MEFRRVCFRSRVRRAWMTRLPEALKDIGARRCRQQQNTGEVPGRAKPCRFRSKVLEGAVEQPRQLEAVVDMNMSIHQDEVIDGQVSPPVPTTFVNLSRSPAPASSMDPVAVLPARSALRSCSIERKRVV